MGNETRYKDTDLTARQEAFCQLIVFERKSVINAYIEAGYKSGKTNKYYCYNLYNNEKIQRRIKELRAQIVNNLTKEMLVDMLLKIAEDSNRDSTKVQAINAISALTGFESPKQVENTIKTIIKFEEDKDG